MNFLIDSALTAISLLYSNVQSGFSSFTLKFNAFYCFLPLFLSISFPIELWFDFLSIGCFVSFKNKVAASYGSRSSRNRSFK